MSSTTTPSIGSGSMSSLLTSVGSYLSRPTAVAAGIGSDLTTLVSSSVGRLAQSSTEAMKQVTMVPRQRRVLYQSFETFYFNSQRYRLILIGLIDGFQIHELTSTNTIKLIAHYTDAPNNMVMNGSDESTMLNQTAAASTPIGMIQLITHHSAITPAHTTTTGENTINSTSPPSTTTSSIHPPNSPYYGTLLAVCSCEDRPHFPRSMLKIFSLPLQRYVHLLRFRSKIFGVHTHPTSRYMIVTLENELHVYTTPEDGYSLHFDCIWSTRILPNPSTHILAALQATLLSSSNPTATSTASLLATSTFSKEEWSVAAMSQRWCAYCLAEPLSPNQQPASIFSSDAILEQHPSTLPSSSSNDSLSTVAKGIASGLYNLGGMGKLAVANYLSGDANASPDPTGAALSPAQATHQQHPSSSSVTSVLGTVLVRDIVTQRPIAQIRAHPNTQITHLVFDRSGTLLATVPVDGQYIHIYQIVMVPEPQSMANQTTNLSSTGTSSTDHSPQQTSRRSSLSSHSPSLHPSPIHQQPPSIQPTLPQYHTRFLYRLFRGITHAVIHDIAFSFDSKYVSVVSAKGTTHIYAIHPTIGGDVSIQTHGPIDLVDDNSLTQQMVSKYSILRQQLLSGEPGGETGQLALDSFLYQPKTISALYRMKPGGVATAFSNGPHYQAPMYMPVIATFDRLDQPTLPTTKETNNPSSVHHLLISNWNEEVTTFALTSTPMTSGEIVDPSQRPKLSLQIDPLMTFDLHPSFVNNATITNNPSSAVSSSQANYSSNRRGSQQLQPHQQAHMQQQFNDGGSSEDEPTVRIITQREDDMPMHQQPHQQYQQQRHTPVSTRSSSPMMQRPLSASNSINFFQQLESDKFPPPPVSSISPASSSMPITIPQRSSVHSGLHSHSPIFAALAQQSSRPPSADSSPSFGATGSPQSTNPASRWLSEVELRTYQSSDVPIWASPQFTLKSYEAAPTSSLFIERAGSKPMVYDKFSQFSGLRTDINTAASNLHLSPKTASIGSTIKTSTSTAGGIDVEDAINSALSSSMLDDASFVASLVRANRSASPSSAKPSTTYGHGEIEFDPDALDTDFLPTHHSQARRPEADDDEGQQTSMMFNPGSGPLISGIDEQYYASMNGGATNPSSMNGGDGHDTLAPGRDSSTILRSSPGLVGQSSELFPSHASASEILFARLPPTNNPADSIMLSQTPLSPIHTNATATMEPAQTDSFAAVKHKKKKKKANGLKVQELEEE